MKATIDEIIVNGSPIYEDMTFNVQLSVVVRGSGFFRGNMEFVKVEEGREVQYTPLGGTPTAPLFILTDNGVYRIYCNGYLYRTITIEGMILPTQPYRKLQCGHVRRNGQEWGYSSTAGRCLNYPARTEENSPRFVLYITAEDDFTLDVSELSYENCGSITAGATAAGVRVYFAPSDDSKPSVIRYEDVICLVTNYDEQQRRRR